MYHVPVRPLAERVLSDIRRQELLKAGDRVGVAVSGGIDSLALLRLLLELRGELGFVLSVVHFNHKLRGAEADADQEFVAKLAREFDLQFRAVSGDVARHAAEAHVSIEAAARELRYGFFRYLLGEDRATGRPGRKPSVQPTPGSRGPEGPLFHGDSDGAAESRAPSNPHGNLDKIATGHTLDDQAETVLMRIIRGAGLRGMGGIYPRIPVEDDAGEICGTIVRPLLGIRRRDLERYLKDLGQSWREDATNLDAALTRNRVRKLVLPLLEKEFNPAVAENLAELSEIARGEEDYWENEVAGWMGTAVHWAEPEWAREALEAGLVQISVQVNAKSPTSRARDAREMGHPGTDRLQSKIDGAPWLVMNAAIDRLWFLGEPVAVQRRVVKAVGEQAGIPLEFRHVEEILRFAAEEGPSGKELSLPLGWKVAREPEQIVFLTPDLREPRPAGDYEYELRPQGTTAVSEIGIQIELQRMPADAATKYESNLLLDPELLTFPLKVRNWRPGDRFWPAHSKSPRKIKELLQERHVPQPERRLWPVVVSGDEIVWLRGFPVAAKSRGSRGREAILILEQPLAPRSSNGRSPG